MRMVGTVLFMDILVNELETVHTHDQVQVKLLALTFAGRVRHVPAPDLIRCRGHMYVERTLTSRRDTKPTSCNRSARLHATRAESPIRWQCRHPCRPASARYAPVAGQQNVLTWP